MIHQQIKYLSLLIHLQKVIIQSMSNKQQGVRIHIVIATYLINLNLILHNK
jgi:hypothetical protein